MSEIEIEREYQERLLVLASAKAAREARYDEQVVAKAERDAAEKLLPAPAPLKISNDFCSSFAAASAAKRDEEESRLTNLREG